MASKPKPNPSTDASEATVSKEQLLARRDTLAQAESQLLQNKITYQERLKETEDNIVATRGAAAVIDEFLKTLEPAE